MAYFIKIDDGIGTRRLILESSKASIHMLRGYQQLLVVRQQKIELMGVLRRQLKEITVLLNQAEALMPIVSDRELQEMMQQRQIAPVKEQPKPTPKQQQKNEPSQPPKPAQKQVITVVPKEKMPRERSVYIGLPENAEVREASDILPPLLPGQAASLPQQPAPKATNDELEKLRQALADVEDKLGKF